MKRVKKLEYRWIFGEAFTVKAYTIKHTNGNTYVIYAHDFNDMSWFFNRLDCMGEGLATYQRDCFDHFETRHIQSFVPNKKGEPKKKPFWYRGRVYLYKEANHD